LQETLVRAWRGYDRFEGRAELRSWLYRIATNVCLDLLGARGRRALPVDLGPAAGPGDRLGEPLAPATWIEPFPDRLVSGTDPADLAVDRESVRLAFVAALQHLGPRQRAVLILRDVLRWRSAEVAELLDTTTTAVDSALRRARAVMAAVDDPPRRAPAEGGASELLRRYIDAFERFDMEALTALLRDDAEMSMPPHLLWLHGPPAITGWLGAEAGACARSRLVPIGANHSLAVAHYRPTGPAGALEPFGIHVLDTVDGRIRSIVAFLDPSLFPLFGVLPPR